jgi:hypothetical protein
MTTACRLSRISSQIVVSTFSSPPGLRPKAMVSRTLQAILGHPRHGGEPHAGGAAHHVENGRNGLDPGHKVDVGPKVERQIH